MAMKSYWIDTHCHMNDEIYRDNLAEYMQRASDYGVGKSLFICMNRADLEYTFELKKQYPDIDIAFGYHPEDAEKITEEDLVYLEEMANDDRIIAIGEIGLDYYWDKTYKQQQMDLFVRQIEIANKVIDESLSYVGFNYPVEISLTLVDDETIRLINKEYRDIDKVTDVLSFPLIDYEDDLDYSFIGQTNDFVNLDTDEVVLGDIIISVPKMRAQALEYNHSELREYAFLIAHSMLHLVGYDHIDENDRLVMEEKQDDILKNLGITRD